MEWGRAKKFVVILLVLLNVGLAGLNYMQNQEKTMTANQEKAIFRVLSQNGISVYTDLSTETAPMFRLEAEVPVYTKEALEAAFFEGEKTRITPGTEESVYKGQDKALMMRGNKGRFEDSGVQKGVGTLDRAQAVKKAQSKMEALVPLFGNMSLSSTHETGDGWQLEFYAKYQGEPVFSNGVRIFISQGGIYQIDFTYTVIKGYSSQKKDICLSDEALLVFMREWNKKDSDEDVAIQKIELGYDLQEEGSTATGTGLYLEPCYRIYLMGTDETYLVNAYTGSIVKKEK